MCVRERKRDRESEREREREGGHKDIDVQVISSTLSFLNLSSGFAIFEQNGATRLT